MSKNYNIIKNEELNKNRDEQINHFEMGRLNVYYYHKNLDLIIPINSASKEVIKALKIVAIKFKGKNTTTKIVEQEFSRVKKQINFKVKRSEEMWIKGLNFYYTIREFPDLVKGIIKEMEIGKKMLGRSMGLVLKVIENCGGKIVEKNKN